MFEAANQSCVQGPPGHVTIHSLSYSPMESLMSCEMLRKKADLKCQNAKMWMCDVMGCMISENVEQSVQIGRVEERPKVAKVEKKSRFRT